MKVKQRDKHEEFVTRLRSSDMDRKLIKSQEMGFFGEVEEVGLSAKCEGDGPCILWITLLSYSAPDMEY